MTTLGKVPWQRRKAQKELLGEEGRREACALLPDSVLPSALSQDVFSDPALPASEAPSWSDVSLNDSKEHRGNPGKWSFRLSQESRTISVTRTAHSDVDHEERRCEKIDRIRHCVVTEPAPPPLGKTFTSWCLNIQTTENPPRWGGMWVGGTEQQRKMLREGV